MRQARHRQKPYHMNIINLEEFGLYPEGNGMFGCALQKRSSRAYEANGLEGDAGEWKEGGQLDN